MSRREATRGRRGGGLRHGCRAAVHWVDEQQRRYYRRGTGQYGEQTFRVVLPPEVEFPEAFGTVTLWRVHRCRRASMPWAVGRVDDLYDNAPRRNYATVVLTLTPYAD